MRKLLHPMLGMSRKVILGMSRKVIQVFLNDMYDTMKRVSHFPLKSGACIINTKWKFAVWKGTPRIDKGSFMLISWFDTDLVITWEAIHEGKWFTSSIIVYNLVNAWGRIVSFGTNTIQIMVVDAYLNCSLFFINGNHIRYPFCQGNMIDEIVVQQLFNFCLNGSCILRVDWPKPLSNGVGIHVSFNLMIDNRWINFRHFFLIPRKNITKFLK